MFPTLSDGGRSFKDDQLDGELAASSDVKEVGQAGDRYVTSLIDYLPNYNFGGLIVWLTSQFTWASKTGSQ